LGLDSHGQTVYVQLGAGNVNEIQSLTQKIVSALNAHFSRTQIVLAESPISRSRLQIEGTYTWIRDFPNSIYFEAFDLAILAAGYNSVYETIFTCLPAIFFPNTAARVDDQLRRAKTAERLVHTRVMDSFDRRVFVSAVQQLLEQGRAGVRCEPPFPNGAVAAARLLQGLPGSPRTAEQPGRAP
jgi:UDP:flavonoid glycosyltransferase YjiC (YdhE family)